MVLTRDADLVASLRRDGRVNVVAHVEDPAVVRGLAASGAVDAIYADEALAAELAFAWPSLGAGGEGGLPALYIVRPSVEWGPAAPNRPAPGGGPTLRDWWASGSGGPAGLSGPAPAVSCRNGAGLPAAPGRNGGLPSPPGRNGGLPVSLAPEVLMRQTIVVVSPKGGVGKTFISVNLATALARHTGFRVLFLDLDLGSGDAAVHLDLVGRPTLAELLPYVGALEAGHLARAVVTHPASGLDTLLAPAKPEAAETFGREHLASLLRLAQQAYDFVVIDTRPDPTDPLVALCLEEATAIVLVSSLDAAALRHCRLYLESGLHRVAAGLRRRLCLVLNQVHAGGPLPVAQAARFLETGLGHPGPVETRVFTVPEDRPAVERAVYDGRPLVLGDPGHPVSRGVYELGQAICPVFGGLVGDGRPRRAGLARLAEALRRW